MGTPATRADIIEKLVKDGYIRREKRRIVPTEDGIRLTAMLPDVVKGKCGAYCKNRCGMNVSRVMGTALTDGQVKSMLEGKKTLVKGLKGKRGSYDAYLTPEDVEDYSYTKDGKEIKGTQYKVKLEFPKKKNNGKSIRI